LNPFKKIALWYRTRWFFSLAVIAGSLCLLLVLQELYSFRSGGIGFCDFEVYYRAAGRLLRGENLYREAEDGHFVFKYSPTAALLFIPFSLAPLWLAKILYWLFLSFAIVAGYCLSLFIVAPGFRENAARTNGMMLLAAIVMWPHIWAEFTFGQVNYLLLVAYTCVAWLFIRKKAAGVGALLAFTIFIKPYGLIFIPYFVIKKRFREVGWLLVFFGLFFLLPVALYRSSEFLFQQREWLSNIGLELGGKQDLLREGNHTFYSLLVRYSPLDFIAADSRFFSVLPFIVVALLGALALWIFIRGAGLKNAAALDFAFMLSLMPLAASRRLQSCCSSSSSGCWEAWKRSLPFRRLYS